MELISTFQHKRRRYVTFHFNNYYRRISYVTFLFNNYHCTRSIAKSKLLNGTETSFRRALISDNSVSLVRLKRELWVGAKHHRSGRGRGGGGVIMSTPTSKHIPNQKASLKKD